MNNYTKYLEEHHAITETAIGTAKLLILERDYGGAFEALKNACDKIDAADQLYRPRKRQA